MKFYDSIIKKRPKDVTFLKKYYKDGFMGKKVTYEIYSTKNKEIALKFLEEKKVDKPLYYIIVDTPEGSFGRDIDGIYQER